MQKPTWKYFKEVFNLEKSVILNAADLKDDVVETTTKKILANPEKFYLLSASSNMKLCNVIDLSLIHI